MARPHAVIARVHLPLMPVTTGLPIAPRSHLRLKVSPVPRTRTRHPRLLPPPTRTAYRPITHRYKPGRNHPLSACMMTKTPLPCSPLLISIIFPSQCRTGQGRLPSPSLLLLDYLYLLYRMVIRRHRGRTRGEDLSLHPKLLPLLSSLLPNLSPVPRLGNRPFSLEVQRQSIRGEARRRTRVKRPNISRPYPRTLEFKVRVKFRVKC